eukprot:TRINITY_DN15174_c1_g1_i3.p1 TRINITY_DN15174_c1_g1~~TRINITY_DN15174_c1_g1_i3.p1  ORF type:complete len:277 (+),score=67.23 TRINITY_DN15174_c1_g1_i3:153-983(+)
MADPAKPSVLERLGRLCWDVCTVRRSRKPQAAVGKVRENEENARTAVGRESLSLAEKDLMIQNFARKQQGLPPLEAEELLEREEQLSRLGSLDRVRLLFLKPKHQADILRKIADIDVRHLHESVDKLICQKENSLILDVIFDRVAGMLHLAPSTSFRLEMAWKKMYRGFTEHDFVLSCACDVCVGALTTTKKIHARGGVSKEFRLWGLAKELNRQTGMEWSEGKYHDMLAFAYRLAQDDLSMWRWLEARRDGDETTCEDNGHVLALSDDEDGDASG